MGHYVGPKARINRRLGMAVFESAGAVKAFDRRPDAPPGMHLRRGKQSDYGKALVEKQKVKYHYGLSETQLRRFLAKADRHGQNVGGELLRLCERRFDNVVRRSGLTLSRPQARQGITHGHFLLNGRKSTSPSTLLRPGDEIRVRNRPALHALYGGLVRLPGYTAPDWISVDPDQVSCRVLRLPDANEGSLVVEIARVIELLAR